MKYIYSKKVTARIFLGIIKFFCGNALLNKFFFPQFV